MDLLLWQKIPIRATRPGATPARHSTDALAPAAAALADRAGAAAAPPRRIASTAPPLPPRRPAALPAAPSLFCESAAMSAAPEYPRPRVPVGPTLTPTTTTTPASTSLILSPPKSPTSS